MKISQSTIDAVRAVREQNQRDYEQQQAEIRAFDTHAKLSLPEVDPLEVQLLAHFRACSEKGRRLIALHAASVASLCIGYKTEA